MFRIAVTGGIACGKTLVGSFLSADGVAVCEADTLAHEAMARGGTVFRSVLEAFGEDVLAEDGSIDRGRLGRKVFADRRLLAELNEIVHPAVKAALAEWSARVGSRPAAAIIPLLYEAGWQAEWDTVVCVTSFREVQIRRLLGRGLSAEEAGRRIDAQMPLSGKEVMADYVVANNWSRALAEEQTRRVVGHIVGR
jgi:dephospho-CoA kinase